MFKNFCEIYNVRLFSTSKFNFEKYVHVGFLGVSTCLEIKCCTFHLGQSLFQKIQNLSIQNESIKKSEVEMIWLNLIFGLVFL